MKQATIKQSDGCKLTIKKYNTGHVILCIIDMYHGIDCLFSVEFEDFKKLLEKIGV